MKGSLADRHDLLVFSVASDGDRERHGEAVGHDLKVDEPSIPPAVVFQAHEADRNRHFSSSIGLRTSDGSWPGGAVEIRARRFTRAWPAALIATLVLAACDADPVAARAILLEHGLHAAALRLAGPFDRPCRFGEPYALRFVALDESGARVSGALCSGTEDARDARVLLDEAEGS